jgi:hypothetical protein
LSSLLADAERRRRRRRSRTGRTGTSCGECIRCYSWTKSLEEAENKEEEEERGKRKEERGKRKGKWKRKRKKEKRKKKRRRGRGTVSPTQSKIQVAIPTARSCLQLMRREEDHYPFFCLISIASYPVRVHPKSFSIFPRVLEIKEEEDKKIISKNEAEAGRRCEMRQGRSREK